jgi:hypothetical protein
MKPYKILRPIKPLWDKPIEVFITEKKQIKLPLVLFRNCQPLPKDKHIMSKVKVIEI